MYFAVISKDIYKVGGYQSLTRIVREHGSIGVGHVFYGAALSRTRAATEAQYLAAKYIFHELKYRRYEWKCDNANEESKKAAVRFGFTPEAMFRQSNVMRGMNRDSAWYSIIDREWPLIRTAFEAWLDPGNFDEEGRQLKRLEDIRAALKDA
ncbi:hypothetical protein AAVH_31234 [Aphelenchoides avenae]|nr:hypothetical protein AAVH_31234 [Aphelenchus avenae]